MKIISDPSYSWEIDGAAETVSTGACVADADRPQPKTLPWEIPEPVIAQLRAHYRNTAVHLVSCHGLFQRSRMDANQKKAGRSGVEQHH